MKIHDEKKVGRLRSEDSACWQMESEGNLRAFQHKINMKSRESGEDSRFVSRFLLK